MSSFSSSNLGGGVGWGVVHGQTTGPTDNIAEWHSVNSVETLYCVTKNLLTPHVRVKRLAATKQTRQK